MNSGITICALLALLLVWWVLRDWLQPKCNCPSFYKRIRSSHSDKHRRECPYYQLDELSERIAGRR